MLLSSTAQPCMMAHGDNVDHLVSASLDAAGLVPIPCHGVGGMPATLHLCPVMTPLLGSPEPQRSIAQITPHSVGWVLASHDTLGAKDKRISKTTKTFIFGLGY